LRIGTRSDPTSTATSNLNGTLNLGASNTITASSIVAVAGGGHVDGGALTTAANSSTVINTPTMDIGTLMRASGSFTTGSDSTLTVQGISGGRTALIVGEERNASTSINWSGGGTMNLSGGQATLKLSSLVVGRSLFASSEVGSASGTLTMSSNTSNQLDISGTGSVVQIGVSSGNQTTGTMTVHHLGSNSTITSTNNGTAILVGNRTTGTGDAVSGTLNLNGGTVTITTTGAAIAGGSNATSNLNLSGGVKLVAGVASTDWIKNLDTAVIGSGGAAIDTNGNNVGVSQAFSGTGGLIKDGLGTLELKGANTYSGATQINAGALVLSGDVAALAGGDVAVGSSGTFGGKGTVGGNVTFAAGAKLAFDQSVGSGFTVASGKTVSFGGFSIANLVDTDGFELDWDLMDLDSPYTLIGGLGTISWTNVSNVGLANAADVGTNRKAYFQEGNLQLVVIPEPATFGIVLSVLAAAVIRHRRRLS
jgi:fibronectin-binding autotransporter adhesin